MSTAEIVGSGPYVLGLDGGTEGMRVGLFDALGQPVMFVREAYESSHARPGWAEQSPQDWWDCAVRGVRRILHEARIDPAAIAGMALACTSYTLVCSDEAGRPLRPAMMWMDVRARQEAEDIAATGDESLRYTGYTHASAEWMPSKALWLKRHEPVTYSASAWISDYVEWMGFRLTGERAASVNSSAIRCYYDRLRGGWPESLFEAVGASDLVGKLASRVLDMGEVVGHLTRAAGQEMGLRVGMPVAQGGADAFVGMIGLGVVQQGSMALITGSSHLHLLQAQEPHYADGLFGAYTDAVIPGQFTVEGGQSSTGSVINWFRRIVGSSAANGPSLVELSAMAGEIRPGSEGVMALDFWQGNRTPYVDADARGMFWGLSLHHGQGHMFRALLESVCFGTENVLRTMRAHGHEINDVVACGGATNSPTWMQIHADVSGLPIRTTAVPEAVTLGSAILASVGAGLYSSITEATAAMVRSGSVVEPNLRATEDYAPYMDLYVDTYQAMKSLMRRSLSIENTAWERAEIQR
ncbi:ribulokinase [Pseudarthrobacter sp. NPDC058329]|uniref:FGGY-family carbohydrate kinase n=1 Tax=Pseudarthrobacter sp. NPDC058329 TaxID=3346448 RepID=UPI0036DCF250